MFGYYIIGSVPSILCRLCIWLRESFHMHGRRICSVHLCIVDVIFDWYMIWYWYTHVVHCWYVIMNCFGIWIIPDYDICLGGVASTVEHIDIIDYVMLLIYCHSLWLLARDCPVDSVSFVYMVTGEFPYAWPPDLFRSTLCRCSIQICIMISLTGR